MITRATLALSALSLIATPAFAEAPPPAKVAQPAAPAAPAPAKVAKPTAPAKKGPPGAVKLTAPAKKAPAQPRLGKGVPQIKAPAKKAPGTLTNAQLPPKSTIKRRLGKGEAAKLLKPRAKRSNYRGPVAKWDGPMQWKTWDEMIAMGAARKPVALLIYSDSCPHCRNLAPVFKDPEILKLAEGLTMVKQAAPERPVWMARYNDTGRYVPKLIFLDKDLNVRKDLTSNNKRYPYFYTPHRVEALKESMKRAATLN